VLFLFYFLCFNRIFLFFQVFDVLYVTSVAFAAIFISPLEDMEDMSSGFAFGFSVSLTCNALILGLEKLEIIMKSHSKAAQGHCRMGILMEVLPRFSCFLAASLMTGLKWARGRGHIDTAGGYSYSAVAWLFAGAHVLGTLFPLFGYLFKLLPASPIPWHYQHIAHRYGELIMLMLGEGKACNNYYIEYRPCKVRSIIVHVVYTVFFSNIRGAFDDPCASGRRRTVLRNVCDWVGHDSAPSAGSFR
jgi:hypothetical protein